MRAMMRVLGWNVNWLKGAAARLTRHPRSVLSGGCERGGWVGGGDGHAGKNAGGRHSVRLENKEA